MTCVIIRNKTSAPTSSFLVVVALVPLFIALALHSAAAQEIDDKYEIEAFINASLEACRLDALEYCGDVAPGDGRLGQCLRSLGASLSEGCASALDALSIATIVVPERFSTLYPTLENRELGEPIVNEEGEAQVWGRALPFLGQKVVDLGFELPNPYGVAIIPAWIRQDLILDNLFISVDGGPTQEIDFVDFGTPEVRTTTAQLKFDAWILPFLNLYATVGKLDGEATVPLTIQGSDLFAPICAITPNAPVCSETYSAVAEPDYHGENISLGMTLAMGWKEYFVAIPITYAWSEVNIIDTTVTALNISPRFGVTGKIGENGMIAAFVGATYLDAEIVIAGQVSFDTPEGPEGDQTTIDYSIRQRNKDKWNYLLGFNWDINKNWSISAESGFGGSRDNMIAVATFRF